MHVVGAPRADGVGSYTDVGAVYVFTGHGSNWTQTQKVIYTGAIMSDQYGTPNAALAATQKEIFVGGGGNPSNDAIPETVIRYRI